MIGQNLPRVAEFSFSEYYFLRIKLELNQYFRKFHLTHFQHCFCPGQSLFNLNFCTTRNFKLSVLNWPTRGRQRESGRCWLKLADH